MTAELERSEVPMGDGMLTGLRVVEIASAHAAMVGKWLGDLGAEVILVEPPDGHKSRWFEPFVDDQPGLERSLWWHHYNTSKSDIALDIDDHDDRRVLYQLMSSADVIVEGESAGYFESFELGYGNVREVNAGVVWVSVTPYGSVEVDADRPATDLTLMAEGGAVWSCGYDDHDLPPVRPGGNQAYQLGSLWGVKGALIALLVRETTGVGQRVDVSMLAAVNVTTEQSSYEWLVRKATVQRQTARHAAITPTLGTLAKCKDGRYANTGVAPRTGREFAIVLAWLDDLGVDLAQFPERLFLDLGVERDHIDIWMAGIDDEVTAILSAARDALTLIASRMSAHEFFVEGQSRGFACGPVNAPEDLINDPHLVHRGFPASVWHDDIDTNWRHPGPPFRSTATPHRISRRAPRLDEHAARIRRETTYPTGEAR